MNYLPTTEPLSSAELDHRLERAVIEHERSEKLICIYLNQLSRRSLYKDFGFENVYDYALERFGFCRSKTRALLYLGRRLSQLPALTEALAKGRLGWTKASKIASVATRETDEKWTEAAVASSFRDRERKIRDEVPPHGGRVSIYLTAEQSSMWAQGLELCRRVSGEEIDAGLALEYIVGEFLATYRASAESVDEASLPETLSEDVTTDDEIDAGREETLCPGDTQGLPVVEAKPYAKTHREVLERDGYRCQYSGCTVRAGLHVHHITRRSRFGKRSLVAMNAPSNLVTLCWFHHRTLHAEVIGLSGTAPDKLDWRRPSLMETATERHDMIAGDKRLAAGTDGQGVALSSA